MSSGFFVYEASIAYDTSTDNITRYEREILKKALLITEKWDCVFLQELEQNVLSGARKISQQEAEDNLLRAARKAESRRSVKVPISYKLLFWSCFLTLAMLLSWMKLLSMSRNHQLLLPTFGTLWCVAGQPPYYTLHNTNPHYALPHPTLPNTLWSYAYPPQVVM